MADEIRLKSFPSSAAEALTILYMKNQDLSGMSPDDLVDMYLQVLKEVKMRFKTSPAAPAKEWLA